MTQLKYGDADTTYQSAGCETGIRALVDAFYDIMSEKPEYKRIWLWHRHRSEVSRDKLARFLCGWMGGPNQYMEKYGSISIPNVHAHLNVTEVERDMWLNCMKEALDMQSYSDSLKEYLLEQLAIPAERVRLTCEANMLNK